jgi:hypothetical protein
MQGQYKFRFSICIMRFDAGTGKNLFKKQEKSPCLVAE